MLVRWNRTNTASKALESHLAELNRWSDQLFSNSALLFHPLWDGVSQARTEQKIFTVKEEEEFYLLTALAPGVSPEQVEVKSSLEELTVRFQMIREKLEGFESLLSEREDFEVERSFKLPKDADQERVEASLVDGVLSVKVWKVPEVMPRKIDVSVV